MVVGPILESLKYTYDKEEIKNMFLNLLAASMNIDTQNKAHPSYVEIIKQLTPLDAKIFKKIHELKQVACAHLTLEIDNENKIYAYAYPNYLVGELLYLGNMFDISSSISNLIRLGLIQLNDFSSITNYDYEKFKKLDDVLEIKNLIDANNKVKGLNITTHLKMQEQVIVHNDFGEEFAETCL